MNNPWNLTPKQCDTLAALAEVGSHKHAARTLGISYRTVEAHSQIAKLKMGEEQLLPAVVRFDRWKRGQ